MSLSMYWDKVYRLREKRRNKRGQLVKPITPLESRLMKKIRELSSKRTRRGINISRALRHSQHLRQSAKRVKTKTKRSITNRRLYSR